MDLYGFRRVQIRLYLPYFSGKAKDFEGTIVSEQAKKLIEKYKNQFDRLAKKNKGRNAYDNSTERYDVVKDEEDNGSNSENSISDNEKGTSDNETKKKSR